MATPEADAAIEMRANVATRARSNGVRSGDEPSRRKPPAPSAGEIMDVFLGASAKLDLALKRLDTIAAQVETLRRSQSVYLGDHIACTYLQNGWRIFVDTRSFDVGIHLLMGGVWETMHSRVFERMLFRGAGVLDVGANLGFYSVVAGPHIGPEGLLVAIEANPHLARLVHYSLAINGLLRWGEVHNVAAGSAAGIVELIYDPHMPGGGAIRPASTRVAHPSAASAKETRTVPVCAIDALLGERRKRINVVKMDIEGAEAQAFEGMRQLLVEARPLRILLEYNGHGKHIADGFRKLQPLLEAEGFEPLQVLNEAQLKPTTWDDLIAKAERQDIVVARKDDRGWISIA